MTSLEEGETAASEDMPSGNPEELAKNPTALKGLLEYFVAYSYNIYYTVS